MAQPSAPSDLSHHYVTSWDNTNISYYSTGGSGPNLLVVHGAVNYALTYREFANALSPYFNVHVMSRRQRGLSGQYPGFISDLSVHPPPTSTTESDDTVGQVVDDDARTVQIGGKRVPRVYSSAFSSEVLKCDVADLKAVATATKASRIIAVSSGAIITLHALAELGAAEFPLLEKVVIFEPPLLFADRTGSLDVSQLSRFETELTAGDVPAAMTTAMYMIQLGPTWIPRVIMKWLSGMMIAGQEKRVAKQVANGEVEDEGVSTMGGLGRALRYDFAAVEAAIGPASRFAKVGKREGKVEDLNIMLLYGTRSPMYLQDVTGILAEVIKQAKKVQLEDVGHEVLCGKEMRGQPTKAVPALREFLA